MQEFKGKVPSADYLFTVYLYIPIYLTLARSFVRKFLKIWPFFPKYFVHFSKIAGVFLVIFLLDFLSQKRTFFGDKRPFFRVFREKRPFKKIQRNFQKNMRKNADKLILKK